MSVISSNFSIPEDEFYRISVGQYHNMIRAGIFTEDDPIELIEGALVFKTSTNKPHSICVSKTLKTLVRAVNDDWIVRAQDPITLLDGEPEPDIVIAQKKSESELEWHPTPEYIGLVIEIADSSISRDRGIKLRSYARAGIAHYWIINLIDRIIEVYEHPTTSISNPEYQSSRIVRAEESIALPAIIGEVLIRTADLLP